jgi:hypothetical protein
MLLQLVRSELGDEKKRHVFCTGEKVSKNLTRDLRNPLNNNPTWKNNTNLYPANVEKWMSS